MERKRHMGYIKSTGSNCVIVAANNPKHTGFALIVQQDSIPDQYYEYLMDAVNSGAGQQSISLVDFLQRRNGPNDANMLRDLYNRGFVREEPVSNIMLVASKNEKLELSKLVEAMNPNYKAPDAVKENYNFTKSGSFENNNTVEQLEEQLGIAKNLLAQAAEYEREANRKREEAYKIYPQLRPSPEPKEISFLERIETSPVISETHVNTAEAKETTTTNSLMEHYTENPVTKEETSETVNITIPEVKYPFDD